MQITTDYDYATQVERIKALSDIHELVRLHLGKAFCVQSKYYNLRHRSWTYHVGDRVFRREVVLSSAEKGTGCYNTAGQLRRLPF